MSEVEDGMGFSGLAPTAEERRQDAYEDTRRKIARTREQQLAKAVAALREIEEMAADRADVDDGIPDAWMRVLVIARDGLNCAISSPQGTKS